MNCYYHPNNPLLNFCINPQCSLPLCPKCINLHLTQSNNTHQIMSLNEALSSISQQLQTICAGLNHELKSLKEDYHPNTVMNDYKQMLHKYRQEALNEINRHYDYLQRQLLTQINTRYSQHLQSLVVPLEDQLNSLEKARKSVKSNDRALETLILVVSQESILTAQTLLVKIKDKKLIFKAQLPRLAEGESGKLRMTAQRIEIKSQRELYPPPIYANYPPPPITALSSIDRIIELQARLQTLRYTEC